MKKKKREIIVEDGKYQTKEFRILPHNQSDIIFHPRVKVLGEDKAGFTIVEAQLKSGEDVCWRCGSIVEDQNHNLKICPICGLDFND